MHDAFRISDLHDLANAHWHDPNADPPAPLTSFEHLVLAQHHANFDLWHEEDAARDPGASDAHIARIKRAIDGLNQRRNDLVEQLDLTLLQIAGDQPPQAPLHSETPGLIIDRLSILSLKIFHTAEQTERYEAGDAHRARNRERLRTLETQRRDLAGCLAQLWADVLAGRKRFKLYRQLKMYNDPTLNPSLYRAAQTAQTPAISQGDTSDG